jgi:hypothetical protein
MGGESEKESVINEGVGVWEMAEEADGVGEVSGCGESGELDEAADGVVVGGETETDELGVVLSELRHG